MNNALWPAPALLSDVSHELLLKCLANWTLLHYVLTKQNKKQESETDTEFLIVAYITAPVFSPHLTTCLSCGLS